MESRNAKLHRSDIEMNMPPRWGFSSFGVGGYNDVAPPELKSRGSPAARTAALIQFAWRCRPSRGPLSKCGDFFGVRCALQGWPFILLSGILGLCLNFGVVNSRAGAEVGNAPQYTESEIKARWVFEFF